MQRSPKMPGIRWRLGPLAINALRRECDAARLTGRYSSSATLQDDAPMSAAVHYGISLDFNQHRGINEL